MNRTEATAERGEKSNTAQLLGRAGMACYGVVHLVIAYLALQVAFGDNEQADQKGALGRRAVNGGWAGLDEVRRRPA